MTRFNMTKEIIFMTEPPHCSIVLPTFREFYGQVEQESANNARSAN